jgi:hypothetical protein
MTRYFVDTNVLIGLTFSHDRWAVEAERILDGHNTLFTSEFVIYEYCSRPQRAPRVVSDPDRLQVDPDDTGGVFGTVLEDFQENVEDNIPMYNREIDLQRYDGLSFERILEIFFDNIEIRSQAKPHFVRHFQNYFSSREVTPRNAKRCVEDLRDRVLYDAKERKNALMDAVHVMSSTYDEQDRARSLVDEHIGIRESRIPPVDSQWLLDAIGLAERGVLHRVVTGDKKDVVRYQQQLTSLFDVSILYILDEFHARSQVGQDSHKIF